MGCQGNEVKCQLANHLNISSSQLKKSHQLFVLPSCQYHYFFLFQLCSFSLFPLVFNS